MKPEDLQYVVPTGNFGDILAGYFAKRMGLPVRNLVVATNENDILQRFWTSGAYEKSASSPPGNGNSQTEVVDGSSDGAQAQPKVSLTGSTDAGGVKATLSPAMDILVSSNFERLLWYLAFEAQGNASPEKAGERLNGWMKSLKEDGRLKVNDEELKLARRDFLAERVSDDEVSLLFTNVRFKSRFNLIYCAVLSFSLAFSCLTSYLPTDVTDYLALLHKPTFSSASKVLPRRSSHCRWTRSCHAYC